MSALNAILVPMQTIRLTAPDLEHHAVDALCITRSSWYLCCALALTTLPAHSETALLLGGGSGYGAHSLQLGGLWTQPWDEVHQQLSYGVAGEIALWRYGDDDMTQLSLVPLLQYDFMPNAAWQPFVFAGVGPAWISSTQLGPRDLSSEFQFSSRVGMGVKKGPHSLAVEARHLSNGGIKEPNQGISYWDLTYGYHF